MALISVLVNPLYEDVIYVLCLSGTVCVCIVLFLYSSACQPFLGLSRAKHLPVPLGTEKINNI